jgi:hypothetical protein
MTEHFSGPTSSDKATRHRERINRKKAGQGKRKLTRQSDWDKPIVIGQAKNRPSQVKGSALNGAFIKLQSCKSPSIRVADHYSLPLALYEG